MSRLVIFGLGLAGAVALGGAAALLPSAHQSAAVPRGAAHPSQGPAHLAAGSLLVFRSAKDMDEAQRLIARDVQTTHPELIAPFVACLASGGEAVTVLDETALRREVILDSGANTGCRGWTAMENVVP